MVNDFFCQHSYSVSNGRLCHASEHGLLDMAVPMSTAQIHSGPQSLRLPLLPIGYNGNRHKLEPLGQS